jgi:hypothetical protein
MELDERKLGDAVDRQEHLRLSGRGAQFGDIHVHKAHRRPGEAPALAGVCCEFRAS